MTRLSLYLSSIVWLFAVAPTDYFFRVATAVDISASRGGVADDFGIFQWIGGADGGIFHPSQEYRIVDEEGETGIFAIENITEGEILAKIPWTHVVKIDDPKGEGLMSCGKVTDLVKELRQGTESAFAPFVNFALAQPSIDRLSPSGWSQLGQNLLQEIGGGTDESRLIPPVEPTEWLSYDWFDLCAGNSDDELSAKAALLVVAWSDEKHILPLSGMYRHRNGRQWTNADITTTPFRHAVYTATRDIRAGEEIYLSHNLCRECSERRVGYGTAEIFRDYGFLEEMPQRWHYWEQEVQFDLDVDVDGLLTLKWNILGKSMKQDDGLLKMRLFLQSQIRRLGWLRHIRYRDGNPGMPAHEWDQAWKFQEANIQAMTIAIQALSTMLQDPSSSKDSLDISVSDLATINRSHYDGLLVEHDDLEYGTETCDDAAGLSFFSQLQPVDSIRTPYQQMLFEIDPDSRNVMLSLDSIVQIASIYRPHYHEYMVHAAARYLESVKRVIFIGGGDSMLLHEVLKYPELELVVGLELDQMVTRKSFQYFATEPHFDDPRVEWWFGDATKSLLLLTREYWQSFDLVLVDLSETVMALSVTSELDVFEAVALLLKPEGVMVKNEMYLNPLSKVFDHSMQIVYASPILCDQVLTMGSNKVDFLHSPLKDHGIDTLLYSPLVTEKNRHDLLHDYRRNDARAQGKCENLPTGHGEQQRSAGIMAIVDAEQTTKPLDKTLVSAFQSILAQHDLHAIQDPIFDESDGILLIVMNEGYIMARMWPDRDYCNMDINMWGSFHKLKSLISAITHEALGSQIVSSFRVVVGGVYGSSTWDEDRKLIGPHIAQARDCSDGILQDVEGLPTQDEMISAAIQASLDKLVDSVDNVGIAICGLADRTCLAASLLEQSEKISQTIRLSTCQDLDSTVSTTLYDCEIAVASKLKATVGAADKFASIVAVDATVPFEMLQIVNSIWDEEDNLASIIDPDNHVVLVWSSLDEKPEPWRKQFLDRYRRQFQENPISHAEYWIQVGGRAMEFGVVVAGNEAVTYPLRAVEDTLKARFEKKHPDRVVDIALKGVTGGLYPWWDADEIKEFLQSDYDDSTGLAQYFEQDPLAHHVVFQFEKAQAAAAANGKTYEMTATNLQTALQASLEYVGMECPIRKFYNTELGDGCVLACLNPNRKDSVMLVWDGQTHIDISYYRSGPNHKSQADEFLGGFLQYTHGQVERSLRDNMSRGTGRVINMADELLTREEREAFLQGLKHHDEKDEADVRDEL